MDEATVFDAAAAASDISYTRRLSVIHVLIAPLSGRFECRGLSFVFMLVDVHYCSWFLGWTSVKWLIIIRRTIPLNLSYLFMFSYFLLLPFLALLFLVQNNCLSSLLFFYPFQLYCFDGGLLYPPELTLCIIHLARRPWAALRVLPNLCFCY